MISDNNTNKIYMSSGAVAREMKDVIVRTKKEWGRGVKEGGREGGDGVQRKGKASQVREQNGERTTTTTTTKIWQRMV